MSERTRSLPARHLADLAGEIEQMSDALRQIAQGYCYVGSERRYLEPHDLRATAHRCLVVLGYAAQGPIPSDDQLIVTCAPNSSSQPPSPVRIRGRQWPHSGIAHTDSNQSPASITSPGATIPGQPGRWNTCAASSTTSSSAMRFSGGNVTEAA